MNQVPLKSDPRAAKWLDQSIDVCKAMGITLSMPACFGNGDLDMGATKEIDELVRVLKAVAARRRRRGSRSPWRITSAPRTTWQIIDRVGSPAMKVYYDVGNSTDKGYDIYAEIRELGKHDLCEFHAKDGRRCSGQGRIDFSGSARRWTTSATAAGSTSKPPDPHGLVPDYRDAVQVPQGDLSRHPETTEEH